MSSCADTTSVTILSSLASIPFTVNWTGTNYNYFLEEHAGRLEVEAKDSSGIAIAGCTFAWSIAVNTEIAENSWSDYTSKMPTLNDTVDPELFTLVDLDGEVPFQDGASYGFLLTATESVSDVAGVKDFDLFGTYPVCADSDLTASLSWNFSPAEITVSVLAFGTNPSYQLNGGDIATLTAITSGESLVTAGCENQVWTLEERVVGEATFTFPEYFPYLSIKNRPTTIEFPNLCGVQALGTYYWHIKVSDVFRVPNIDITGPDKIPVNIEVVSGVLPSCTSWATSLTINETPLAEQTFIPDGENPAKPFLANGKPLTVSNVGASDPVDCLCLTWSLTLSDTMVLNSAQLDDPTNPSGIIPHDFIGMTASDTYSAEIKVTDAYSGEFATKTFDVIVSAGCGTPHSISITESLPTGPTVLASGSNTPFDLNSGSALNATAADHDSLSIPASCLSLTWTITASGGTFSPSNGPVTLDVTSAPASMIIPDLNNEIPGGTYTFNIEVRDATSGVTSSPVSIQIVVPSVSSSCSFSTSSCPGAATYAFDSTIPDLTPNFTFDSGCGAMTYSCSLLGAADSSSAFNPCSGFDFSTFTGALAPFTSAYDVKSEPISYFTDYSIQITATSANSTTSTCSYSLTLSAPCTDPLFCTITVPSEYEQLEYTIGSSNPLQIPHPPQGEFIASREDVCGQVLVFLQQSYDGSLVTPSQSQITIESSDTTHLDDPIVILEYGTTLYEHQDYSFGPEYQVWVSLLEGDPVDPEIASLLEEIQIDVQFALMASEGAEIENQAGLPLTYELGNLIASVPEGDTYEDKIVMDSMADNMSLEKIGESYWLFIKADQEVGTYQLSGQAIGVDGELIGETTLVIKIVGGESSEPTEAEEELPNVYFELQPEASFWINLEDQQEFSQDLGQLMNVPDHLQSEVKIVHDSKAPYIALKSKGGDSYELAIDLDKASQAISGKKIGNHVLYVQFPSEPSLSFPVNIYLSSIQVAFREGMTVEEIAEEHNSQIQKPHVKAISTLGDFEISFSDERLIEVPEETSEEDQLRLLCNEEVPPDDDSEVQTEDRSDQNLIFIDDQWLICVFGERSATTEIQGELTLCLLASDMSDPEELGFMWSIEDFSEERISIQLEFENPDVISINPDPEELVVYIKNLYDQDGSLISEDFRMRKELPPQLSDGSLAQSLEMAGNAAAASVAATSVLNIVLSFMMQGILNQMLATIKQLQLILHLALLNMVLPANTGLFFGQLDDMLTFDPIPDDYIPITGFIGDIFQLKHDYEIECSLGEKFEKLGYESPYLLENMGSMTIILMLQLALIPFFLLFSQICVCSKKIKDWNKSRISAIFFNGILAFIDGTYLLTAIMASVNLRQAIRGQALYNSSFWIALTLMLAQVIEIFAVSIYLKIRFKKLDGEKSKARCGYIYEQLKYKTKYGGFPLAYPILYQARFLILTSIVLFAQNYRVTQTVTMAASGIIIMTLLGVFRPFQEMKRNKIEMFSETVVLFMMDLLFIGSIPTLTPDARSILGFIQIVLLGVYILYSQGLMLISGIRTIKLKCKRRQALKKAKKIKDEMQKLEKLRGSSKVGALNDSSPSEVSMAQAEGQQRRRKPISADVEVAAWDLEDKTEYQRVEKSQHDDLNVSSSRLDGTVDVTPSQEINEVDQSVLIQLGLVAGPVEQAPSQAVGLLRISEADEEKEQESQRF